MPDSSDTNPPPSRRDKTNIQSMWAFDGRNMTAQDGALTGATQGQRLNNSPTNSPTAEYMFDVPKDMSETVELFRKRIEEVMGTSNHSVWGEQSISSSQVSGSPSESLVSVGRRERMMLMEPRITFTTLKEGNERRQLIGKLQKLWQYLSWHEQRVIPSALEINVRKEFDKPNKTRPVLSDECFAALHNGYVAEDYTLLGAETTDVLKMADKYRYSGCTEAHWTSIVVIPLLNLVRRLNRYQSKDSKLAVLYLASVEISPSTLCPTSSDPLFKDLDKRIDAAIGLDLPAEKRNILETGINSDGSPSINQTASFVSLVPMFIYVAIRRPRTDRDPLIQLGTWIAAEFKKRKNEGYSLDVPVLAIAIDGDVWDLYMVFASEDVESSTFECRFAGPIEMGSTKSLVGIYNIVDKLRRCADWGIGEYQTWFNEQVLAKYEMQNDPIDGQIGSFMGQGPVKTCSKVE